MKRSGTLFLVRHGESGWNRERLIQGQSRMAPGLTTAGREEAAVAAADLVGSGADVILASDLRRAVETALPIAARLSAPIWLEPRLRERLLGTAEGRPSDQVDPRDLGVAGGHVTDPDARPPGGESVRQLYDRVAGLLRELLSGDRLSGDRLGGDWLGGDWLGGDWLGGDRLGSSPGRRLILVTHGGPIRVARAYLAGLGAGEMAWPTVPNGSILAVSPAETAHSLGQRTMGS